MPVPGSRREMFRGIRGAKQIFLIFAAAFTIFVTPLICRAGTFSGDWSFADEKTWTLLFEDNLNAYGGNVQSICVTDWYIITIENASNISASPDTVTAYWRYDHDANGNPVQQFSRARRVTDTDWEHGNGMTYMPGQNRVYVSLYSSLNPENRGDLWVMDPDTLQHVDTIHLSDDWNALGIQYMEKSDTFLVLTNSEGNYSLLAYSADFGTIINNYGSMNRDDGASNFQDFYANGNYVLLLPLGVHDYTGLHVYNTAERKFISDEHCTFDTYGASFAEPEGLDFIAPGRLIMTVTEKNNDGSAYVRVYSADFSWVCDVSAESTGGSVDVTATDPEGNVVENPETVPLGSSVSLAFSPEAGNVLSGLTIAGRGIGLSEDASSYEVGAVTDDLEVKVSFALPEDAEGGEPAPSGQNETVESGEPAPSGQGGSAEGGKASAGENGSAEGGNASSGDNMAAENGSASASPKAADGQKNLTAVPAVRISGNAASFARAAIAGVGGIFSAAMTGIGGLFAAVRGAVPQGLSFGLLLALAAAGLMIFVGVLIHIQMVRTRRRRILKKRREAERKYIEERMKE